MSFRSKQGLAQHVRHTHPIQHEAAQNVQRVKARWADEELKLLADTEANVPAQTRFMNQYLLGKFPQRTLESIKGQRKSARYRDILNNIVVRERDDNPVTSGSDNDDHDLEEEIPDAPPDIRAPFI